MSTYRCARATTSHAAEAFGWRRRGFPPSGVPRGAPWELDARSPPRRQKDRAGGSLGPKSWERPADRLNKLRWALGRLPLGARRARVPMKARCSHCQYSEISLIRRISMKEAPAATRPRWVFGTTRARAFAAHFKSPKRVRMAKTPHNDRLFGRIGRPISVGGPPATHAYDVEV